MAATLSAALLVVVALRVAGACLRAALGQLTRAHRLLAWFRLLRGLVSPGASPRGCPRLPGQASADRKQHCEHSAVAGLADSGGHECLSSLATPASPTVSQFQRNFVELLPRSAHPTKTPFLALSCIIECIAEALFLLMGDSV